MNQVLASNLPAKFHNSDIYRAYIEEYKGKQIVLTHCRPLKLDDEYEDFRDILYILDTCAYLGCNLPWTVFDFAYSSPPYLLSFMKQFQRDSATLAYEDFAYEDYADYFHFANTPEFEALKLCCEYSFDESLQLQPFVSYAIKHGSVLLVKYFEHKCEYLFPKNMYILLETVQQGRINILDYFMTKKWFRKICNRESLTIHAVNSGQLNMLKFLHKRRFPLLNESIDDAINGSQYKCMIYLLKNGAKPTENSLRMAVGVSELKYVIALVESGTPVTDTCYTLIASQRGRLDVLRYLVACSAPWHENAVNSASRKVCICDCYLEPNAKYRECAEFGLSCNAPYDKDIVQKYLYREKWVQNLKTLGLPVPPITPTDDVWMLDNYE